MKTLYKKLMEAGYSFNDIDEADYNGFLEMFTADDNAKMSAEAFFNSI